MWSDRRPCSGQASPILAAAQALLVARKKQLARKESGIRRLAAPSKQEKPRNPVGWSEVGIVHRPGSRRDHSNRATGTRRVAGMRCRRCELCSAQWTVTPFARRAAVAEPTHHWAVVGVAARAVRGAWPASAQPVAEVGRALDWKGFWSRCFQGMSLGEAKRS